MRMGYLKKIGNIERRIEEMQTELDYLKAALKVEQEEAKKPRKENQKQEGRIVN